MTDTLEGIDTSNLNGDPPTYAEQWWYQRAQFVIAQAIPRGPTSTAVQLWYAKDRGKYVGGYSWLWDDPSWRLNPDLKTDQRLRWATVPQDVELNMRPWVDSEDNQSVLAKADVFEIFNGRPRLIPLQVRKDNLLVALDAADEFAYVRRLPEGGVYTSAYYINLLYDGWVPEGRKLWLANYSLPAGSLLGSHNGLVVAHQFTSQPIDRDIILASEILQKGTDPMSLNVGQGLLNQMKANNDHPISDEFTFRVNGDNTVIQAAYGLKGRYIAANATGQWEAAGPFNA